MKQFGDVVFSVRIYRHSTVQFDIDYNADQLPDEMTEIFTALSDDLWGICDEEMREYPEGNYEVTAKGCYLDVDHEYGEVGEVIWSYPILGYDSLLVKENGDESQRIN